MLQSRVKRFQTTPESRQKIEDLNLAAEAKAFLINLDRA